MDRENLLQKLIKLQEDEGYLKEENLIKLSKELKIPIIKIYEIASFYSFLSTKKKGKYIIRICISPTCYLHKSTDIIEMVKKLLKINIGETTKDGKFSIETTSCIGCCNTPPAIMINDKLYTNLSEEKLKEILFKCK